MRQYLEAYFDGALPDEALDAVAAADGRHSDGAGPADSGLASVRSRLERVFQQVNTCASRARNPMWCHRCWPYLGGAQAVSGVR